MKRILAMMAAVAVLLAVSYVQASPQFPDKGWHKGPYVLANVGMMQVTNDKHVITERNFGGTFDPSFGITFGWDIADWIGPMLQINYATSTGSVGTAGAVTKDGFTFPAGTFPVQSGVREHAVNFSLFAKATHPYFTSASWQPKMVKIIPYVKLGGTGNFVYVNASNDNNKAGAYGGGIGMGGGCEFFIWKGLVVALDVTENLIFQQAYSRTITDSTGTPRKMNLTPTGMQPQFNLQGLIGWHF